MGWCVGLLDFVHLTKFMVQMLAIPVCLSAGFICFLPSWVCTVLISKFKSPQVSRASDVSTLDAEEITSILSECGLNVTLTVSKAFCKWNNLNNLFNHNSYTCKKNLRCIIFNEDISASTYMCIACLSKNNIVLKLDWTLDP